jgi:hypothetical protein
MCVFVEIRGLRINLKLEDSGNVGVSKGICMRKRTGYRLHQARIYIPRRRGGLASWTKGAGKIGQQLTMK